MLTLLLSEHHPETPYRPAHIRRTYFDTESRTYLAQATIGDNVIVEVTAPRDIEARLALSDRLDEVFRAMRAMQGVA